MQASLSVIEAHCPEIAESPENFGAAKQTFILVETGTPDPAVVDSVHSHPPALMH